jgi:hypothetical protein
VINQSKIRWALRTFKPFKYAGTDGIIPTLLQQGAEHLVPHLCRNLELAWHTDLFVWPGGKLKTY